MISRCGQRHFAIKSGAALTHFCGQSWEHFKLTLSSRFPADLRSHSHPLEPGIRWWRLVLWTISFGVICAGLSRPAQAQFELLRSFFEPRGAAPRLFEGDAELNAAFMAAERGETAQSLEQVHQAFAKRTRQTSAPDPNAQAVPQKLLVLCQIWREQNAPPKAVADVLTAIVFPENRPKEFWPYPAAWQPDVRPVMTGETRLPRPQSVAAELVQWSARANLLAPLRQRLQTIRELPGAHTMADVMSLQLAIAERDSTAATRSLTALTKTAGVDPVTDEALLHAVSAGLNDPPSRVAALTLLETILQAPHQQQPGLLGETRFSLQLQAVQLYFDGNRPDDAVRLARLALESTPSTQRYGQELSEHVRQLQRTQMAAVLLNGHRVEEALVVLAQRLDDPPTRYEMTYPSVNVATRLGRELQSLPAEKRFAILRSWVLPDGGRTQLREYNDFIPDFASVRQDNEASFPTMGILQDVYSTTWHLLLTARELGRLDEVMEDLSRLPSGAPDVLAVQTLALLVRDVDTTDADRRAPLSQHLQTLLELTTSLVPKWEDNPKRPLSLLTCTVALEAARHAEWSGFSQELLMRLIEHSQRLQWDRPRPHLRMAWAEVQRRRQTETADAVQQPIRPAAVPDAWQELRPRHWIAAGTESAAQQSGGSLADVWLAHDETIEHLIGRYDSFLFFEYPMTGDFTVSMEVREGGWSEGGSGYGGVTFATNGYADIAPLHAPGRTNSSWGPSLTNLLHRSPWNRQTVEVRNGVVRYYANGQLVHEDQPGTSAPWLALNADWGRTPLFRNIAFTGSPVIPAEIPLLTDHRLRGWVANFYGETRDDTLRTAPAINRRVISQDRLAFPVLTDGNAGPIEIGPMTDWFWENNELRSQARESLFPTPQPSRIAYYRPLQPDDTLEYEFFAQADTVMVHPTVGRFVYLLSKNGVTVKPISLHDSETPVLPSNEQVRSHSITIKDKDWNHVRLTMRDDHVVIQINDGESLEIPLPQFGSREFGWWHDAGQTSVRIRKATLRGAWPKTFTVAHRSAIERPQPLNPPQQRRFITGVMQEALLADNAYGVYRRALQLDGEARYEFLRRWVMPGPDHATLRTTGAFTPTHPSPAALADNPIDAATAEARQQINARRVQTGGSFVCPAVLLVFSALELGRLGELNDALDLPDDSPSPALVRARAAMRGMIALMEDRIDQANAALWECNQLLLDGGRLEQHERWSEPALCSLAILHPATREVAFELLDRIQRRQLQSGQAGTPEFSRYVRHLHGHALFLLQGGDEATFGTHPRLKHWQAVSQFSARTRGPGYVTASFDTLGHELQLRGGHDRDMVYFQSPLRGNFELRARLTHFDYRELMPLVGGISTVVRFDGKNKKVQLLNTPLQEVPLEMPHARRVRSWGDYQIVVQEGRLTFLVDGQKLHEEELSPDADPWVAIQGWAGYSSRAARNVVITGNPEIPKELNLLAAPDLQGWLMDYYGSATGQPPYPWRLENTELQCLQAAVRGATPGRLKIENIIRYHRPLLEDGELDYEFFYDPEAPVAASTVLPRTGFLAEPQAVNALPGRTMVHPALDRLVCLLEPDGVKVHWLTDGRFDRTGVTPDNAAAVAGSQPLPLQKQAWNAVIFRVTGDELTIVLNGETICTHPIEPTNQRQFGFFHYVNESTARVRNVRYRGSWPLTLPTPAEQELATGPEQDLEIPPAELPARVEFDLTRTPFDLKKFRYVWDANIAKFLQATPQGYRLHFPAGEPKGATVAGFAPKVRIKGDFIATVDYKQLKTTPVKESWGSGMSFKFKMAASYEAGIEVRQTSTGQSVNCVWQMPTPARSSVYYAENHADFPTEGRLRLVRRGSTVYFLTAEPGSDDFRLLTTRPLGLADIERIGAQVDCSDAAGGADVLVTHIAIQAQQLVPIK